MDLPTEVVHVDVLGDPVGQAAHGAAGVVVDPLEVVVAARSHPGRTPQRQREPSGAHGTQRGTLEQVVGCLGAELVDRVPAIGRREHPQVDRSAHPGPGLQFVDQPEGRDVGGCQRLQHRDGSPVGPIARRPQPEQVAVGGVDVRLIDRDPLIDLVAQRGDHPADEAQEAVRGVRAEPAAGVHEPAGKIEVVQGHQRADAGLAQPG